MPHAWTRFHMNLICSFALAQFTLVDCASAQHPKLVVPGSEKVVLGAFVLRHPDVLAELKLEERAFKGLHADLEAQIRGADETDRSQGIHRRPPTFEQIEALNWLLLDSLSPNQGHRLIQLLNRQTAVLAHRPHDSRIVTLPIPIFARPIQTQLGVAPETSNSLDQLFHATCGQIQQRITRYRASVNEEISGFAENAHAKLDDETKAKLAALVGTAIDRRLWPQNARLPGAVDMLRKAQNKNANLFPELWFEDSQSALAVGPALNTLIYFLAENQNIAQNELNLTPAQMELILRAADIGRAPLPQNPDSKGAPWDRLELRMSEYYLQSRQQSFVRDEFIATLKPIQLNRFRELVNQVVVGDAPMTWLALDSRVRRRLAIDPDCVARLDKVREALLQRVEEITSEFHDDVKKIYRTAEQEALSTLTAAQRDQYHDWFGPLFAFENPTWRMLLSLNQLREDALAR